MPDILHDFIIGAPPERVFAAVSTPKGLDAWWTKTSKGNAAPGAEYELWFGPQHDWRAVVSDCVAPSRFELKLTKADADWLGTRVGFVLAGENGKTKVRFHHLGWPEANEHYRISSFCWAMYLRLMKRYVETGQIVPFGTRLEA